MQIFRDISRAFLNFRPLTNPCSQGEIEAPIGSRRLDPSCLAKGKHLASRQMGTWSERFQALLAFQAIPDENPAPSEPDPPTANDKPRRRIDRAAWPYSNPSSCVIDSIGGVAKKPCLAGGRKPPTHTICVLRKPAVSGKRSVMNYGVALPGASPRTASRQRNGIGGRQTAP